MGHDYRLIYSPQALQPVLTQLSTLCILVFCLLHGCRKSTGLAVRKLVRGSLPCCQLGMWSWSVLSIRGGVAVSLMCWVSSTYLKTTSEITWSWFPFPSYCAFSNDHPLLSDQWVHWWGLLKSAFHSTPIYWTLRGMHGEKGVSCQACVPHRGWPALLVQWRARFEKCY